ncbi:MAG: MarR family transcriptional regulator [Alphaproteobacteria bacterium]|nr:MarR family transcriptional regulator [Alphaproteobacteria bacterium]
MPARHLDPTALQPGIGYLVHDVSRLIRRRFDRRARQTGLPITRLQAAVILYVARNEGISQAAVATHLDVEPIALVRMLDRLHEEGLVERRAHPTDRRVRTLWLTPLARPVVERILAINQAIREEAYAGLTPAIRDAVIGALETIKGNLACADEIGAAASAPARSAPARSAPARSLTAPPT